MLFIIVGHSTSYGISISTHNSSLWVAYFVIESRDESKYIFRCDILSCFYIVCILPMEFIIIIVIIVCGAFGILSCVSPMPMIIYVSCVCDFLSQKYYDRAVLVKIRCLEVKISLEDILLRTIIKERQSMCNF